MTQASDLMLLAYCTNVHPGETLDSMLSSLDRFAVAVQRIHCPGGVLPIGLWISSRTLDAIDPPALRHWLESRGLLPCTINGFPQGDFHDRVVRHKVYQPTWASEDRLTYTCRLADLLAQLHDGEGSISTLPIGWSSTTTHAMEREAGLLLRRCARHLADLESRTGRYVHIDLEPEPGCVLQRVSDVAPWIEQHLLGHGDDDLIRRHVRICCDTCHLAVMNEEATDLIEACDTLGMTIGKVQISSAVTLDGSCERDRNALKELDESRWLHQVMATDDTGVMSLYEDVRCALRDAPAGRWNVHFHVPVDSGSCRSLVTTQPHTTRSITALRQRPEIRHWEVETYTWSVLEDDESVACGIASEMAWASTMVNPTETSS